MVNKRIHDELNKQINAELYSSYLYLAMAAYFDSKNLTGFANWMKVQAQEEITHAMRIYDYLNDRGANVVLAAIDAPKTEWSSPTEAFKEAYGHEQKVTGMINDLVTASTEEKDHATYNFLQWFVAEQVEEEATASGIYEQLKMTGSSNEAILMIDRELGQRVFTPENEKGE